MSRHACADFLHVWLSIRFPLPASLIRNTGGRTLTLLHALHVHLHIQDGDLEQAILAKLVELTSEKSPLLLLVDNAEDPLRATSDVHESFQSLLAKV